MEGTSLFTSGSQNFIFFATGAKEVSTVVCCEAGLGSTILKPQVAIVVPKIWMLPSTCKSLCFFLIFIEYAVQ